MKTKKVKNISQIACLKDQVMKDVVAGQLITNAIELEDFMHVVLTDQQMVTLGHSLVGRVYPLIKQMGLEAFRELAEAS